MGGLDGAVVYIDTEHAFSAGRLAQIAAARLPERFGSAAAVDELLQRVLVVYADTSAELVARSATRRDAVAVARSQRPAWRRPPLAPHRLHRAELAHFRPRRPQSVRPRVRAACADLKSPSSAAACAW